MTSQFRPAGYLIQRRAGEPPEGDRGTGYDYVLAANGLFVQAANHLLSMTVPVAPAQVRGLALAEPRITLTHGPLPRAALHRILREMQRAAPLELFAAVTWDEQQGYRAVMPPQQTGRAHVSYQPIPDTVLEIHSHGDAPAFFSDQDDQDEQGLAIYAVAGRVSSGLTLAIRAGVYGHFLPLRAADVFTPA